MSKLVYGIENNGNKDKIVMIVMDKDGETPLHRISVTREHFDDIVREVYRDINGKKHQQHTIEDHSQIDAP